MRLAVNIDHVATVREARGGIEPDPVHAAILAELAGADGIVAHLREDRRHINDRDIRALRDVLSTKLDLEMAATTEIIAIALDVVPDLVTLVPEKRQELTTEGGLDVVNHITFYHDVVSMFHDRGIAVSLFIEPDPRQVDAAVACKADIIELHTGTYANARTRGEAEGQVIRIRNASEYAHEAGLVVTAGHGLDLRNLPPIVAIPQIEEVSIGHALIGRALFVGMTRAVEDYMRVCRASLAS
ncbi:MAG: pyridoxine 5'-phosphate synthase [Ignavibacteriae bacterium]|nr:MAG: pyridoxine 5'-phosphate synthase [Ignavibacteriota bacterium]